jgi:hypothetical protein
VDPPHAARGAAGGSPAGVDSGRVGSPHAAAGWLPVAWLPTPSPGMPDPAEAGGGRSSVEATARVREGGSACTRGPRLSGSFRIGAAAGRPGEPAETRTVWLGGSARSGARVWLSGSCAAGPVAWLGGSPPVARMRTEWLGGSPPMGSGVWLGGSATPARTRSPWLGGSPVMALARTVGKPCDDPPLGAGIDTDGVGGLGRSAWKGPAL